MVDIFPLFNGKSGSHKETKIYVVEDNPGVCEAIMLLLQDLGYQISGNSNTAEEALEEISQFSPDLILMDINLAGKMDGVEAATRINNELFIPVVFLTGNDEEAMTPRIVKSGSYGYLVKPYNERELTLTIEIALYKHQMDVRIRQSEQFYHTLAEALEDGIIIIDGNQEIRYLNAEAQRIVRLISGNTHEKYTDSQKSLTYPEIFLDQIIRIMDIVSATENSAKKTISIHSSDHEYWLELHAFPIIEEPDDSKVVLIIVRDITLQIEFEMEVRMAGLSRIEENMEKFQILNDQIRNPLQVMTGLVDIEESPLKLKFLEQIKIIDQVIRDFDEAWTRSEKVRRFLLTHYGHGTFLKKEGYCLQHRNNDNDPHDNHHHTDHNPERTFLFSTPRINPLRRYTKEDEK